MKLIKRINNKEFILLGIFFVLFTLSYTTNVFHISQPDLFHGFERQPEGLVVGRLARSAQDGIFSYGALNGVNYNKKTERTTEQYAADLAAQHHLYLTNTTLPDGYQAYKSQSGGQGILFSMIQKISPLDNASNLMLFRGLNALLIALIFCLFCRWIQVNFGFITTLFTLLLLLLSPWLNVFSHNLWWILWSFYLPFIAMTLVLAQRNKSPDKVSEWKIWRVLFLAVFLKCLFTGFEFITTALLAALSPIVYYCYLEKRRFIESFLLLIKAGMVMLAAVLIEMVLLIVQIRFLEGTFYAGVEHIVHSFTKRTITESASYLDVFIMYMKDDAFSLGFLPNNMEFYFGVLILIILISATYLCLKKGEQRYRALGVSCIFSILAPMSWLIVFKQHAFEHPHMDYIIWYMPFLLYGFVVVGVLINLILQRIR